MPDDKRGRDKEARDADRRQRERDLATELERGDEREPPVDAAELDDFETQLETLEFPATGTEVVAAVGDREVESVDGTHRIEELVPDTDEETFDAPSAVRVRVERPTVAAAMKRIVGASERLPNAESSEPQRDAYEKTLRELEAIDADGEAPPPSKGVHRRAAEFCRANGYPVRNDEWLGR